MANWITEAEALSITGEALTDAQISKAQIIIDIFSGVSADVDRTALRARDLLYLQRATALQAVWMVRNRDILTRMDLESLTQSGLQMTPTSSDDWFLAPASKRYLKALSWKQTNTISPNPSGRRRRANGYAYYGAGWCRI